MKKQTKKITKKVVRKEEITPVCDDSCCCKKPSKILLCHLVGLVILAALAGVCFYKFGIVATVNGKPIYRLAYIKALQKADSSVLDQMIQTSLIEGEALNKKVVVAKDEIDQAIKTIEDQVKTQGSTLEEALKSENMTKEQLESQIRIQKIAEKLASPSADPTQAEIDSWLKTNKDYLPKTSTKEELQNLAKEQLKSQAQNTALNNWFTELKKSAKIVYR